MTFPPPRLPRPLPPAPPDVSIHLVDGIAAFGDRARPALHAMIEGALVSPDGPDEDVWAAVHAQRILGRLSPSPASVRLALDVVRTSELDWLVEAAVATLAGWRDAGRDEVLAALGNADDETRPLLVEVLVQSGVRDDETFLAVLDAFARAPEAHAGLLAAYGDARALPALRAALDGCDRDVLPDGDSVLAGQLVLELEDALRVLGGAVTAADRAKVRRVLDRREERGEPLDRALTELACRRRTAARRPRAPLVVAPRRPPEGFAQA